MTTNIESKMAEVENGLGAKDESLLDMGVLIGPVEDAGEKVAVIEENKTN